MDYYTAHTFFIIMVVFGILAVTAFLVCVIKVIIKDSGKFQEDVTINNEE